MMYVSANQKAVSLNLHRYNEGFERSDEVISLFFQYVEMMRRTVGAVQLLNPVDPSILKVPGEC
jgi:secreted Zn-dependent insulinase-like peptidase